MFTFFKAPKHPVSASIHLRLNRQTSFSRVQSVQYRNPNILIHPSRVYVPPRICSTHVSSLLLEFRVMFRLGLFVSTTSETKRAYSRVRTNNRKHQAQNEQCHERHTTRKEIQRNLTSTHSGKTNKRSNQKLYNLNVPLDLARS